MILPGPAAMEKRRSRVSPFAAVAALLFTAGLVSTRAGFKKQEGEAPAEASGEASAPAPDVRNVNRGGAPYYRCDGQKKKTDNLDSCDYLGLPGVYRNEMSNTGCGVFWTAACFECCGIPAPFPSPPPPSPPPLLGNKWANAGLNTGITFAKMGAGTGFKFLTSNPLDTDYGKLGQQTGKEYSEQGLGTADKFIALDDSGRAKTAAGPGLTVFKEAVTAVNTEAAKAVGNTGPDAQAAGVTDLPALPGQ